MKDSDVLPLDLLRLFALRLLSGGSDVMEVIAISVLIADTPWSELVSLKVTPMSLMPGPSSSCMSLLKDLLGVVVFCACRSTGLSADSTGSALGA